MFTGQQMNQPRSAAADSPVRTIEEVRDAINNLTTAELLRLENYARWRIRIVPLSLGYSWEDLLSEAIETTLSAERSWSHGIRFINHLLGAVRSISSCWRKKISDDVIADELRSAQPHLFTLDPERHLLAQEKLNQIKAIFAQDPTALAVLNYLSEGYTAEEIQAALNLSPRKFDTTKKRVRRRAQTWLAQQEKAKPSNANYKPLQKSYKAN